MFGKLSSAEITKGSTKSVKEPDKFDRQHRQPDGVYKKGNRKKDQAVSYRGGQKNCGSKYANYCTSDTKNVGRDVGYEGKQSYEQPDYQADRG